MITRAMLRYIRISPRKFRQVISLVKGKRAEEAIAILKSVKKNASGYCIDLIISAIANTRRMPGVEVADLYISKLTADGGPTMKRFRAGSMGRAGRIIKRTSHIILELDSVQKAADAVTNESAKSKMKFKPQAAGSSKIKTNVPHESKKPEKKALKKTVKKGKE